MTGGTGRPGGRSLAWRRRARRAGKTALAIIAVLAVVEIVLRLVGAFLYRPIDRSLGRLADADPNAFRILCIGDSHTQGMEAPIGLSYPDQLERLLNAGTPRARYVVVNQGVAGYNSAQALIRLREILEGNLPKPRLVLVCVGKNNAHNLQHARFWNEARLKDAPVRVQAEYLLEHSKAFQLGWITQHNLRAGLSGRLDMKYADFISWGDRDLLSDWLAADYGEMIDRARGAGARFALVTYYYRLSFVDDGVRKAAGARGVPVLDVTWPATVVGLLEGLLGRTGHPNARGYGRIARDVQAGLLREGLIPDAPGYPRGSPSGGTP
jgi:lysophospholipase L1-like esterase